MILADFLVQSPTGLYCVYGDFYLDPKVPVKTAVISHAHGDHAIPGNAAVYCTKATSLFMKHRYRENAAGTFHLAAYKVSFNIKEVADNFYPGRPYSGFGTGNDDLSGVNYLYTGDFKLQDDATCEPFEFIKADVLITETTFANPTTRHPLPEQEMLKLNDTTANVMLGAYVLGKSQRLIHLMNKYCPGKRVLVHHSVLPFMRIYEQEGVDFGDYELYDKRVMKTQSNIVYIVPPIVYNSNIKTLNLIKVFATGWKDLQRANQIQLYVSDHADWEDIILTISKVQPSQVWTTHGSGHALKAYFGEQLLVKMLN